MDTTFDLGLIFATREEFEHCRELLPFTQVKTDDSYHYAFTVPRSGRRGAAVTLFDMGLVPAAQAATSFLNRFDVSVLALVGIAGALQKDLRLGDVVVASSVDSYMAAGKVADGSGGAAFRIDRASHSIPLGNSLKTFTNHFRYTASGAPYSRWRTGTQKRATDLTQPDAATPAAVADYFLMPVATGDLVVGSEAFAQWLRDGNRLRGAVEMEAGGVAHAVYAMASGRPTDFLVVRGISDFADARKSRLDQAAPHGVPGVWRRLATQNAFALLLELVGHDSFPWQGRSGGAQSAEARLAGYRRRAARFAVAGAEAALAWADSVPELPDDTGLSTDDLDDLDGHDGSGADGHGQHDGHYGAGHGPSDHGDHGTGTTDTTDAGTSSDGYGF